MPYYNESGDEITREEFESPQYHEPTPDNTVTTDDGWLNNAIVFKNNADWNERMDRESQMETAANYGKSLRNYTQTATPIGSKLDYSRYWTLGNLPKLEYGTLNTPARDITRLGYFRRLASGSAIQDVKEEVQRETANDSGLDPTMRRLRLKDVLKGYGSALSKIMGSANQIAQQQYDREYADKYNESLMNYKTGISKANAEYQAELQKLVYNAGLGPEADMRVMNYRKV